MSEIEQLRAELARLQGRLDELEQVRSDQPVPRRHMLRALGGVAAGAAVGGLAFAKPTAAADGDPILLGAENNVATSGTTITAGSYTPAAISGIFGVADSGFGAPVKLFDESNGFSDAFAQQILDDLQDSAISGAGGVQTTIGVIGTGQTGVKAYGTDIGVQAFGGAQGGVFQGQAIGLLSQATDSNGIGAKLDGDVPLKLTGSTAPSPSTGAGGQIKYFDQTLYVATGGLGDPQWRRLASIDSAGVFVPVTPFRVFDSRKSGSPLTSGSDVTIDCSDARDADTGAVTVTDALPAGTNAIAFNITVVETSSRGFLSVNPGGTASASASTINWGADNDAAIANGSIVKVDANRQIKIFCGGPAGNSTQYIVDVVGYYH